MRLPGFRQRSHGDPGKLVQLPQAVLLWSFENDLLPPSRTGQNKYITAVALLESVEHCCEQRAGAQIDLWRNSRRYTSGLDGSYVLWTLSCFDRLDDDVLLDGGFLSGSLRP